MSIFLAVLGPICGLMTFLMLTATPAWMKVTSGVVILVSAAAFARGYLRRLVVTTDSALLVTLVRRIEIPWSQVASIGIYEPAGKGGARYWYVSRGAGPPAGAWQMDKDTIQVQDREGLSQAIDELRSRKS
ncbi:MAG TPA: hypothetical protein VNT79_17585 [Phycisphaerae bacterium]|nr:hypothetical protein [Phycisphaerae bacterium]